MQQKTKIYLSKSKAGDLTYIAYIRDILHKLDAEILEFAGGTYNTDALLKSDVLIVVPPRRKECIDEKDAYWVGKGQYEEINTFRKKNPCNSVYIVADTDFDCDEGQHSFLVEEFYGSDVVNINWQTEYAAIETDDCPEFITLFDLNFKEAEIPTLKVGYDIETKDLNDLMSEMLDNDYDLDFLEEPEFKSALNAAQRAIIQKGLEVHEKMSQCTVNPAMQGIPSVVVQHRRKASLACITLF